LLAYFNGGWILVDGPGAGIFGSHTKLKFDPAPACYSLLLSVFIQGGVPVILDVSLQTPANRRGAFS
jgi:hypothetical protein